MDTDTKTIAQQISTLLGDDGQCWTAEDGRHFSELVRACGPVSVTHKQRGMADEPIRYDFADGSVIVEAGACWDLGFSGVDCYCIETVGHDETCEYSPAYKPESDESDEMPSDAREFLRQSADEDTDQ